MGGATSATIGEGYSEEGLQSQEVRGQQGISKVKITSEKLAKPNAETVRHITRNCLLKSSEEKEAEKEPYDS